MGSTMIKNSKLPHWQWLIGIILLLAFSRLIPHPPNFTPLGAMALLAGATIKDFRVALLVPLFAMILSDALLGFHSSMEFVYSAVSLIVLASSHWLKSFSLLPLTIAAVSSATVFFIVTNFGAWLSHDMYPHTTSGLWQAYLAGVPFFRNTLLSNIIFTAASFYIITLLPRNKVAQV